MTANATTAAEVRRHRHVGFLDPRGEFLQGLFIPLTICGLRDQVGRSLRLGINSQDGGPGFVVGIVVRGNDEGGHGRTLQRRGANAGVAGSLPHNQKMHRRM